MPAPVTAEVKYRFRTCSFNIVYIAMFILSLHWSFVAYVNSTYLGQFVNAKAIGTLFVIGSALTVLIFLFISRVLQQLGNFKLTIGLASLEILVLLGMGLSETLSISIPLFVLHITILPLLIFNLDVFMESCIGSREGMTGGKRGALLTMSSFAGALAVLIAGFIVGDSDNFTMVYVASAAIMLPFIYVIIREFKTFQDPKYQEVKVLPAMHEFWIHRDLRFVFLSHLLLQLFFAWTLIYIPLYLATEIGLSWEKIGMVIFFGLLAYVFMEYPIGVISDKYIGEKEMMMAGFLIMAISTAWISFIATTALIPWMVTMFMTRVGASLVEATTESYFFKHTEGDDTDIISFFRITRPLAMLMGALLGSFTLLYLPFQSIFLVLGIVLLPGVLFSMLLNDTR